MLFNSVDFFFFLLIVFSLYWFTTNKNLKLQNLLLLVSSYVFYAYWNYKFLFLLIFSTSLDFYTGRKIYEQSGLKKKKLWLWLSVVINLGFLGIFKYYNFFASSFSDFILAFGVKVDIITLKILLPVGISFYTFHGLSYVIDVYNSKIRPTKNFIEYSVFVSFFPLLVAGPIERATHLLPQIEKRREFDSSKAIDGLRQILWGLFKKIVVADNCAEYANTIFNNYSNYSGSTLIVGSLLFTFQIYGDFSGYSDIALGTAKLFGIDLLRNFSNPYFSRDIAEFWRRWHISLSSWFKDYVYFPLGGSRGSVYLKIRNTFIIFLLSGLWHGANWTFIVWGGLNTIYFLPLLLLKENRINLEIVAKGKHLPSFKEIIQIAITFLLTMFAWIFFRSDSLHQAIAFTTNIFTKSAFSFPQIFPVQIILLIIFFILIEWIGREQEYALATIGSKWPVSIRWSFYYVLLIAIFIFFGKRTNLHLLSVLMKKFLLKITLFVTIFFCIDKLFIVNRNNAPKLEYDNRLEAVLKGEIKSDILIIGSSRGAIDVMAGNLGEQLHTTAYNLSYTGSNIDFHYYILNVLLNCKNRIPKIIILPIDYPLEFTENKSIGFRYDRLFPLTKYRSVRDTLIARNKKNFFINNLFILNQLTKSAFFFRGNITTHTDNILSCGSMPLFGSEASFNPIKNYNDSISYRIEDESPYLVSKFLNFVDCCNKNGIILILAFPPNYYNLNGDFRSRIQLLAKDKAQLMFYDTTSVIYKDPKNFYNASHLNVNGAKVFTKELFGFIKYNHLLKDQLRFQKD